MRKLFVIGFLLVTGSAWLYLRKKDIEHNLTMTDRMERDMEELKYGC
jgi:hypothetical protein